ncbi:hypothetical protein GUJ93_ZPchr0004g38697 [Zizania palustris]|uniref:Uncharacterized protein n=1 Tax=Zizania palustris TaxID=103762 RepID=A0A8J5VZ05_ZIZPA|nr:hypothetical protein GUJ93_ZPchr0004g38697 [Zizania palustris]
MVVKPCNLAYMAATLRGEGTVVAWARTMSYKRRVRFKITPSARLTLSTKSESLKVRQSQFKDSTFKMGSSLEAKKRANKGTLECTYRTPPERKC